MMKFENKLFEINNIADTDLFICAIGYEDRSHFLYDKIKDKIIHENILVFYFDDYIQFSGAREIIDSLNHRDKITSIEMKYSEGDRVQEEILRFIRNKIKKGFIGSVHIDYSSMPRAWYYRLPIITRAAPYNRVEISFWYNTGEYPNDYEGYPSAGVDSYSVIGKSSLRITPKRLHVIALSLDNIRTKALISIMDPDSYITCNAYLSSNKTIGENVRKVNNQIILQAVTEVSFLIDDFSFMVAKLCEIAHEYLGLGDVIFVPDGPKPLIFAMSLVPQLINKEGVMCLNASRNERCYKPVNVKSAGKIIGFSVKD